jgi:uncharacterized membrane protein YfbV (UPF0208 family)
MKGPVSEQYSTGISRRVIKLLRQASTGTFSNVPGIANIGTTWQAVVHAWQLHAIITELIYVTVGLAGAVLVARHIVTALQRSS